MNNKDIHETRSFPHPKIFFLLRVVVTSITERVLMYHLFSLTMIHLKAQLHLHHLNSQKDTKSYFNYSSFAETESELEVCIIGTCKI